MDLDVVAYRPEREGEGVEGEVVAIDVTSSEFTSDAIPVITLKQSDGTYRGVRGYHSTLRGDLEKLDLKVGDTLAIVYGGKKSTRDGKRSYHSYQVRSVKGAPKASANGDDLPAPF